VILVDFRSLLDELERVILDVLNSASSGGATENRTTASFGNLGSANVSVRIGFLDEMVAASIRHPRLKANGPLIDVFETEGELRVVVLLPGVRKEDIRVATGAKTLSIEITKNDTKYHKEIRYGNAQNRISVDRVIENNSVVEIIFRRSGSDHH